MNKETPEGRDTSLNCLMNIIQKSRNSLHPPLLRYVEQRSDYLWQLQTAKAEYHKSADFSEIDYWWSTIKYWEAVFLSMDILSDLIDRLRENPFPSKRVRFFRVCVDLMPNISLGREMPTNANAWRWIFRAYRLPKDYYIVFPAAVGSYDLQEIEKELVILAGERDYVTLAEVCESMRWDVNGKTYREVKGALIDRGWVWGSRRIEGKKVKVLRLPEVEPRR